MTTSAVLGSVSTFQVEADYSTQQVVMQARGPNKLSPAGLRAVVAALDTYYNSTLTAPQQAAIPDFACSVAAGTVIAYAAPGSEATLATALIAAVGSNTVRG